MLRVGERAAWWMGRYLAESRALFSHIPSETAMFLSGYGMRFSPAYLGNWVSSTMSIQSYRISGDQVLFDYSAPTDSMSLGELRDITNRKGTTEERMKELEWYHANFNTPDDLALCPAELDGGVDRP
jgi:hypothetical protein